jgi:hypothetical protein
MSMSLTVQEGDEKEEMGGEEVRGICTCTSRIEAGVG